MKRNLFQYGTYEIQIRYFDHSLQHNRYPERVQANLGPFKLYTYNSWNLPVVMDSGLMDIPGSTWVHNHGRCTNVMIFANNALRAILSPGEAFQLPLETEDRCRKWRVTSVGWSAGQGEDGWYYPASLVVNAFYWDAGCHKITMSQRKMEIAKSDNTMHKWLYAEADLPGGPGPVHLWVWNPIIGTANCRMYFRTTIASAVGNSLIEFQGNSHGAPNPDLESTLNGLAHGIDRDLPWPSEPELAANDAMNFHSVYHFLSDNNIVDQAKMEFAISYRFDGPCVFNKIIINDIRGLANCTEMM